MYLAVIKWFTGPLDTEDQVGKRDSNAEKNPR